jgi:hypothetical protein
MFRSTRKTKVREFVKRRKELGRSIWLFLYYYSLQGREIQPDEILDRPWAAGMTFSEIPCRDSDAARVFGCSAETVRNWRKRLAALGYIEQRRTPAGYVITIPGMGKD